jgi:hypothetical protein
MKDFIELKKSDLNLKEINDLVSSPDCGAISFFVGEFNLIYFFVNNI